MTGEKSSIASAEQARLFFLDRLQAQARAEGKPLSKVELQYLDYGRIPSEEDADRVGEAFTLEFDDDEFSDKITSLIRTALLQDRKQDQEARARYKEFANMLKGSPEDGQLFAFIAPALGLRVAKPVLAHATTARDIVLYVVIGLAVMVILILFATYR